MSTPVRAPRVSCGVELLLSPLTRDHSRLCLHPQRQSRIAKSDIAWRPRRVEKPRSAGACTLVVSCEKPRRGAVVVSLKLCLSPRPSALRTCTLCSLRALVASRAARGHVCGTYAAASVDCTKYGRTLRRTTSFATHHGQQLCKAATVRGRSAGQVLDHPAQPTGVRGRAAGLAG